MDKGNNRAALPIKTEPTNCNDNLPPLESATPAPQTQRLVENTSVKPEPPEIPVKPLLVLPSIPPDITDPSDVLAEVRRLDTLSSSIQIFKRGFDELQNHLDFIGKAIETRFKELAETAPASTITAAISPSTEIINALSKTQENHELGLNENKTVESNAANLKEKSETSGGDIGGSMVDDELKSLCIRMSGRELRKYLVSHKLDVLKLKEQVPSALAIAPNPAKLVLECVGRFYLQGSRAYSSQHLHMVAGRDAAILALECFLLSGCAEKAVALDATVRNEAEGAAIAWKKRLVSEGGVSKAGVTDARGLLMLVASFGIPADFKDEDLADLILKSNAREVSHVLLKSYVLRGRIPVIIERTMKKGLTVEAVDIAYTFGYEDKFSPRTLLTLFLSKSKETWEKAKQQGTGGFRLLEACERYLAALQSVVKCLGGHKIDWMELLPECQIKETMANLMKDITDLKRRMEEKALLKRKSAKIESSSNLENLETKRLNFTTFAEPRIYHGLGSAMVSPSVAGLQNYYEVGRSSRDVPMVTNMYEPAGYSSHLSYYPVSSSAQMGTGVSDGMGLLPAGSNLRYNGDIALDNVYTMADNNRSSSRRYAVEEGVSCNDMSVEQSLVDQLALARANGMYGQFSSLKGFAGLLDGSSVSHTTTSDLYSFADAVVEDQSLQRYEPSRVGHLPTNAPSQNPSYM